MISIFSRTTEAFQTDKVPSKPTQVLRKDIFNRTQNAMNADIGLLVAKPKLLAPE